MTFQLEFGSCGGSILQNNKKYISFFSEKKHIASYKYISLFAQCVSCRVRYQEFAHGKSSLPGNWKFYTYDCNRKLLNFCEQFGKVWKLPLLEAWKTSSEILLDLKILIRINLKSLVFPLRSHSSCRNSLEAEWSRLMMDGHPNFQVWLVLQEGLSKFLGIFKPERLCPSHQYFMIQSEPPPLLLHTVCAKILLSKVKKNSFKTA